MICNYEYLPANCEFCLFDILLTNHYIPLYTLYKLALVARSSDIQGGPWHCRQLVGKGREQQLQGGTFTIMCFSLSSQHSISQLCTIFVVTERCTRQRYFEDSP